MSSIFSASVKGVSIEYLSSEFAAEAECFELVLRFNGSKKSHSSCVHSHQLHHGFGSLRDALDFLSSADKLNSVECGCTSKRLRMPQTEVFIVETKNSHTLTSEGLSHSPNACVWSRYYSLIRCPDECTDIN